MISNYRKNKWDYNYLSLSRWLNWDFHSCFYHTKFTLAWYTFCTRKNTSWWAWQTEACLWFWAFPSSVATGNLLLSETQFPHLENWNKNNYSTVLWDKIPMWVWEASASCPNRFKINLQSLACIHFSAPVAPFQKDHSFPNTWLSRENFSYHVTCDRCTAQRPKLLSYIYYWP